MSNKCRNLECVGGRTPGLRVIGAGNQRNPVLGQKIYWDWVPCPACSEDPKIKAQYKHVIRTESERKERAQWATDKKPFKLDATPRHSLDRVHAKAAQAAKTGETSQSDQLAQQLTKLSQQLAELLAENRELRKQLAAARAPSQADQDMIAFGSSAKLS